MRNFYSWAMVQVDTLSRTYDDYETLLHTCVLTPRIRYDGAHIMNEFIF